MSRSKNNSKNTGRNAVRPYTVMCTDIYLLWILIVFPLYYADGYFHLPEKKAMFWTVSTLVYVIVCLVGVVITAFSMRENWSMENFKKNITMTDVFMFGFLISNLIALLMSDNPMGSWVGQNARYYGARVLILVCVVYFLVSRYAWINQVFIVAFLIGGNGVCLLATFDYFGMDVLGINKQMQQWDWLIFISTMGNANTCASYVCMALAGAIMCFCIVQGKKLKIFAAISVMNCTAALVTARSDSAFLGIGVLLIVMCILCFAKRIKLKNYILVLALVDLGLLILYICRKIFITHLILESFDTGLPKTLNQPIMLAVVFAILIGFWIFLEFCEKKSINIEKKTKKILCVFGTVVTIGVCLYLSYKLQIWDIFKQSMEMRNGISVGSRKYIYTRTIQSYGKLPILQKIFGMGHATVSNMLYKYFGEELSTVGISINSAHNSVLDYLVTIGLFGVVCYLGAILSSLKHMFNLCKENKSILIFGGIIIAYFAQSLFNIEQTNTTTIFWIVLACCEAVYRQSKIKNNMKEI